MKAVIARARILRVYRDRALVESVDRGCGRCDEPGGCGGRGLESLRARVIEVGNAVGAHVGDVVEVSIPGGTLFALANRTYLLPLAGLIGGALVAGDMPWSILGSLIGVVTGFLVARQLLRRYNFRSPGVVRICGKSLEERR